MSTPEKATPAVRSIRSIEDDYLAALQLQEEIETRTSQLVAVKLRLAEHGVGTHELTNGGKVTVSEPPRSFDLKKAWDLLTPDQQAVCKSPDSKLIRQQLPPILAEQCMKAGTGKPRVTLS